MTRTRMRIPSALMTASLALLATQGRAVAVPDDQRAISLQGVLTRDGMPLNGDQVLQFRLYDAAEGGNLMFSTQQKCWLSEGRFNAILEIPEPLLFGFGGTVAVGASERWWSVGLIQLPGGDGLVGGGVLEELPRQPLTAVPQALVARRSAGVQASRWSSGVPSFILEAAHPEWGESGEGASLYLFTGSNLVVRKAFSAQGQDPRQASEVVYRFGTSGSLWARESVGADGDIVAGRDLISGRHLSVQGAIYGGGNISGRTVTVRGADLAEGFEVAAAAGADAAEPAPGMIVSIDPERPGKLRVSSVAYDRRVAGAISGANGVDAGVMLGSGNGQPHIDGPHPVAMAGRVWVHADESAGRIRPGDRLTTSGSRPGHAMRVTDEARAPGAVVGKAMTEVDPASGMVLVLVNLQ